MVQNALLPKPLPADSLVVGQLVTEPLHPERESFYPDKAHAEVDDLNDFHIQLRYKDLYSVDAEGRFTTNYGARFDLCAATPKHASGWPSRSGRASPSTSSLA